ncbi:hypothetical protein DUI87_01809 [Hirundo rustica rustica]|uniref:Uncharacterized protein n=1 Tax=Hirundo rustica rustica TaxID=333673 RepID=A0A3M0L6J1_HIRRU|nr:hypothetical protein DUI87_01809 [Hirundo rustica rustica]
MPTLEQEPGRVSDPAGDLRWNSLILKECTPWKGIHAGAAREELQPVGRTHVGEIHGRVSPMEGFHTGAREGAAMCDELNTGSNLPQPSGEYPGGEVPTELLGCLLS